MSAHLFLTHQIFNYKRFLKIEDLRCVITNYFFNDEPTVIQSFLPNTESTRIGLNASSEEMSIDNGSTRSASKFFTETIKKL